MQDHVRRFLVVAPELYKFNAENVAAALLRDFNCLTHGDFMQIKRARGNHDKAVRLCDIIIQKQTDSQKLLPNFVKALEKCEAEELAGRLNLEISRDVSLKHSDVSFHGVLMKMPKFWQPRHDEEVELRQVAKRLLTERNQPSAVLLRGPRCVGKTVSMIKLLSDSNFLKQSNVQTVIWLNCSSYYEGSNQLNQHKFQCDLVNGLLETNFDSAFFHRLTEIDFQRLVRACKFTNVKRQILVVLDSVASLEPVDLALKLGSTNIRCIALCNETVTMPKTLNISIYEELKIERLNLKETAEMLLAACPSLRFSLEAFQIETLTGLCDGFPAFVMLVSRFFQNCPHHNLRLMQKRYDELTAEISASLTVEDYLKTAIAPDERLLKNSVLFLKNCLGLVPESLQQKLQSFLLFNADQPVGTDDLAVVWNCSLEDAAVAVSQLSNLGLLNEYWQTDSQARLFSVSKLIYSIVFETSQLNLEQIRSSLVERSPLEQIGENVLHRAIGRRRRLIVESLFSVLDPSSTLPKLCGEPTGEGRRTPLHYLYRSEWKVGVSSEPCFHVENYWLFMFCRFVDRLAQIDKQDVLNSLNLEDETGESVAKLMRQDVKNVLFLAARFGFVSLLDVLLQLSGPENRIDGGFTDENGDFALLVAAQNGQTSVVQFLMESVGFDANMRNRRDEFNALLVAASRHDWELTRFLIDCHVNCKLTTKDGDTALMLAASHGDCDFVEVFLEQVNVDAQNNDGDTVLMQIARGGDSPKNLTIANKLLSCGADVNLSNRYGYTALILASMKGFAKLVQLILNSEIRVNFQARTADQLTAMMHASRCGHHEVVQLIAEKLADSGDIARKQEVLDAQHIPSGDTALMLASVAGHVKVVEILLQHGASLDIKNRDGETAWNKATRQVTTVFIEHERNKQKYCSIQ